MSLFHFSKKTFIGFGRGIFLTGMLAVGFLAILLTSPRIPKHGQGGVGFEGVGIAHADGPLGGAGGTGGGTGLGDSSGGDSSISDSSGGDAGGDGGCGDGGGGDAGGGGCDSGDGSGDGGCGGGK